MSSVRFNLAMIEMDRLVESDRQEASEREAYNASVDLAYRLAKLDAVQSLLDAPVPDSAKEGPQFTRGYMEMRRRLLEVMG